MSENDFIETVQFGEQGGNMFEQSKMEMPHEELLLLGRFHKRNQPFVKAYRIRQASKEKDSSGRPIEENYSEWYPID